MVDAYYPQTLNEALQIINDTTVIPYAGGTDLMIMNNHANPFIFIGKLPELTKIYEDDQYIHIGACVTYTQAYHSKLVPRLMHTVISKIASPAIRNKGTFGGNLGNRGGKADSVLADFVLDAIIKIQSVNGERLVPVISFYLGKRKIDLAENELITEILIPKTSVFENCYFEKISARNSLAISNISFGASWNTENGIITCISIAIGAAGDTVLRCPDLEELLVGKNRSSIEKERQDILDKYQSRMDFPLDRTSIDYRKTVCELLIDYLIDFAD